MATDGLRYPRVAEDQSSGRGFRGGRLPQSSEEIPRAPDVHTAFLTCLSIPARRSETETCSLGIVGCARPLLFLEFVFRCLTRTVCQTLAQGRPDRCHGRRCVLGDLPRARRVASARKEAA